MTSIVGVGIGPSAPEAKSAGAAMTGAAVSAETGAAGGQSVKAAMPGAAWSMAKAAAVAERPTLKASKFSKNSGKSRRKNAAIGMAAVSPVATMSALTMRSRCSVADVFAGRLSNVAPVYLPWESKCFLCLGKCETRRTIEERRKVNVQGSTEITS
jgi:hypothetical protein